MMVIDMKITKTRIRKALTKERFRNWLKKQKGENEIGRSNEPFACPIHTYLYDVLNIEDKMSFGVLPKEIEINYETVGLPNPKWAECFINEVDKDEPNVGHPQQIVASHALAILNGC